MIQRVFLVLLLCAFGFACGDDDSSDVTTVDSGGDGDGDGDGDGAVTLSGDVQPIFDASCASVACHDSQNPAQGLDLSSGASQAALVGVNSTASACSDEVLVVAGDSSSSYLLDKIDGTQACGSPMPISGSPLSMAQRQLIADWIDAGAPNN